MTFKLSSAVSLFLASIIFISCGKKPTETTSTIISVDTTKFEKIDSIPISTKHRLRDTVLTIKADSIKGLYYPNTGKEVMTLKKGDVCKITRAGRYDVIDGKGNFWIRVERFGGKGWIFGGQTSLESDVWVFSEGMTERGHPYNKYNLNELSSADFEDLFEAVGKNIESTEYDDGENGSMSADVSDDKIIVKEVDNLTGTATESFVPGPETDSVKSINYTYVMEGNPGTSFNHTLITFLNGSKISFTVDLSGELKDIFKVGNNYLFVTDYTLSGSNLGNVHYTNMAIWSPKKKRIIERHRFGYSGVEPNGKPIFKPCEDGSFISMATSSFAREDGKLTMQVFETYDRVADSGTIEAKVFFVTRYFTFNESTNRFEESKQEVLYMAK